MLNEMPRKRWTPLLLLLTFAWAALIVADAFGPTARAQTAADDSPNATSPSETAATDGAADEATSDRAEAEEGQADEEGKEKKSTQPKALSLFWLLGQGGWLMVPIYLMSFLVVAFAIERGIGLRRSKVLPDELIASLGSMSGASGGFDPRKAYRLCQEFPSAASSVIRAMLLKVGRPQSEVEHAAAEASEREAGRMHANVRWLTLAAAVAPLLGLFGTVWGMINAFYDTANLPAGMNKAEALAEGIYVALVTTLAGLFVAIPAAILAHFFEGKIQSLFYQIDEMLFSLLPQIERYEGKLRVTHQSFGDSQSDGEAGQGAPQKASSATMPK